MKSRLFLVILSGYLIIISLGTLGLWLSFRQAASREFRRYVFSNQESAARQAAESIADYYRTNRGFEGLQDILRPAGRMGRHMGMPMARPARFVVTDRNMSVVADTSGQFFPGTRVKINPEKGVPVRVSTGIVGYVFPAHLLDRRLPPEDMGLVAAIQRGAAVSLGVVAAVSIILAVLFSLYITTPIHQMNAAAADIAKGDFSVRVDIPRKDEIGDLGRGFNKMARSLETAETWRRQIIKDTAHELRTPVSILSGRLELISEGIYPATTQEMEKLSSEMKRLEGLIQQLEKLSGLEDPGYKLALELFSMDELIRSRIDFFTTEAAHKGIELDFDQDDVIMFSGDSELFTQVIDNLLSNSIRHTPAGGSILVSALLKDEGRYLEVSVEDSGPGIPEGEEELVFQRYYRADPSRSAQKGGRGLGLSIAREICRLHNGEISAGRGEKRGGARFVVTLPVYS